MQELIYECPTCKGHGVTTTHLAEDQGIGYICHECHGAGKVVLKYTPFSGQLKTLEGITIVRHPRHSEPNRKVNYDDFLTKGEKP